MTEPKKSTENSAPEKVENEVEKREEKTKKARLRTRGPYRKAHVDW